MKGRIIKLPPAEEAKLWATCIHEAGHGICAAALGLRSDEFVSGTSGIAVHAKGTPAQNAVVAWAGVCAEDLFGVRAVDRKRPLAVLNGKNFSTWHSDFWTSVEWRWLKPLENDISGIRGSSDTMATLKDAWRILSKSREQIEWLAEKLADEARNRGNGGDVFLTANFGNEVEFHESQINEFVVHAHAESSQRDEQRRAAGLPPKFPARTGAFIEIVCGGDPEVFDKFNRWRAQRIVKARWTSGKPDIFEAVMASEVSEAMRTMGRSESQAEELAVQCFSRQCHSERSDFLHGGFANRQAWDAAADEFENWKRNQTP